MELTPIKDVLSKSQKDFISKKAYNYAAGIATNSYMLELLYSKYYLQFLQEAIHGKCSN